METKPIALIPANLETIYKVPFYYEVPIKLLYEILSNSWLSYYSTSLTSELRNYNFVRVNDSLKQRYTETPNMPV